MAHITYSKQPLARGGSDNAVLAVVAGNPSMRAVDIAKRVGISRERVRQILVRAGLATRRVVPPPMPLCRHCGVSNVPTWGRVFCSETCKRAAHHTAHHTMLLCSECGIEFMRTNSDIAAREKNYLGAYKTSNVFCSKRCQGNYIGKHYGFVVHQQRRKFPMPSEILAMREAGKSPREIAAAIGSTMHYIYEITWRAKKTKRRSTNEHPTNNANLPSPQRHNDATGEETKAG